MITHREGFIVFFYRALIEPESLGTGISYQLDTVAHENERTAALFVLSYLPVAFERELQITDRKHLIGQKDFRFRVDGDGKAETDIHAGGVSGDRGIKKFAYISEIDNGVELF